MTPEQRQDEINARKRKTGRQERLWVREQWQMFDVWQVPVNGLLLNVDNHRFRAERTLMEEKLGHSLDPENSPEDEHGLEVLLLDGGFDVVEGRVLGGKPGKDYEALRADWSRRHQEFPLWIRPDGTVRNGNRRLAMLRRLQREEGLESHEYVDAVILDPGDIDEVALFDMEQREQLTENLKVRYTDINLLLSIRDAAEAKGIDWFDPEDITRVANLLQHVVGNNASYAAVQLNAIKYMDQYLEDSGQPRQYHKLINQIERFRDVGRTMVQVEQDYPDEASGVLRLMFAAIRSGQKHGTIRELRRMFRLERDGYRKLLAKVEHAEEAADTTTEMLLADPVLSVPEDNLSPVEDEDSDAEPPGPNVPN
jgi:hypothetical protein